MHAIWAVAKNTIKQALRMKVAVVFIILLLILLPVMGSVMTGDGTIMGRLQTFISYSLSLVSLLLCLLTIVVSIYSITSDLDKRQVYTVLTKPIRRFEFIFGKLLGILILDAVLLSLFAGMVYGVAVYIPKYFDAKPAEIAVLDNEFFTARAGLKPVEPDVTKEVQAAYAELESNRKLPAGVPKEQVISKLTYDHKAWKRAAVPGQQLLWRFENVKPVDPEQSLFLRFKYEVSSGHFNTNIHSRWFVGDDRQFGGKIETPVYPFERRDIIRNFHEIEVPADAVAEDGYVAVGFINMPVNNTTVIFEEKDGLELLYKADTFTANFIRSVILIYLRLVFLACMGILSATFLSFPVAIMLCLLVFFTGTVSTFVIDSFGYLSDNMSGIYSFTVKPIVQLLPRFDQVNPAKFLIPARLLSWTLLVKMTAFMVCIKAVLLVVFALLIFASKEIAKIII
ncbi:ABC transporter permease [Planctomycetota bacterium]